MNIGVLGELLMLAVKGTVALDALRLVGAANFVGKPVIDATNPIAHAPRVDGSCAPSRASTNR